MIDVTFKHDEKNKYLRLEVRGHAGSAPMGEDIICASASILTYTLAQIVLVAEKEGKFNSAPVVKTNSGDAVVACRCKDDDSYAEMIHTYYVVQIGFYLLQSNFPDHINVSVKGDHTN